MLPEEPSALFPHSPTTKGENRMMPQSEIIVAKNKQN